MAKDKAKSKGKKKGAGKGKTKSKLTLSQRRERANELFSRGYTDVDVAAEIGVSRNTAAAYRKIWREGMKKAAAAEPGQFRDGLTNTKQQLAEVDQVRAAAWQAMERKEGKIKVRCDGCRMVMEFTYREPPSDSAKIGYLNILTKTADQRAKLLGLLGIEQNIFIEIQNINHVNDKMLAWMGENLTAAQREKLADFIEKELSDFVGSLEGEGPMPVLDSGVIDAIVRDEPPVAIGSGVSAT